MHEEWSKNDGEAKSCGSNDEAECLYENEQPQHVHILLQRTQLWQRPRIPQQQSTKLPCVLDCLPLSHAELSICIVVIFVNTKLYSFENTRARSDASTGETGTEIMMTGINYQLFQIHKKKR